MTVRYHGRRGQLSPDYVCQKEGVELAKTICQQVPGAGVDEAVGELLLATVTPVVLEVALAVERELEARAEEADRLRYQHVERARYEAELARRRYLACDPENRLVADALEAEWNERLRALASAQEEYERAREADRASLSEEQRRRILALATDFPRLWRDPNTPHRERKRMIRLLIADVTLVKGEGIAAHVRFKGGQTRSLSLRLPPSAPELRRTPAAVVAEIDRLLGDHTEGEVAAILNERGLTSGEGRRFHRLMVQRVRRTYGLKDRFHRLRERGMLTLGETSDLLGVASSTVKSWRRSGLLEAHPFNDKGECLYVHPGAHPPVKMQGRKLAERAGEAACTGPNRGGAV